jgi:hypothetical protein
MNARQRCRLRRQMRYREQCRREAEIRQLRLQSIKPERSLEEIIDNIFGLKSAAIQTDDSIHVLVGFIARIENYNNKGQAASFDNCCLPDAYLYSGKSSRHDR